MRFVARSWKEGKYGRVPSAGDVRSVDIEIQAFQAWAVESPDAGRELRKARCEQLSRAVLAHTSGAVTGQEPQPKKRGRRKR